MGCADYLCIGSKLFASSCVVPNYASYSSCYGPDVTNLFDYGNSFTNTGCLTMNSNPVVNNYNFFCMPAQMPQTTMAQTPAYNFFEQGCGQPQSQYYQSMTGASYPQYSYQYPQSSQSASAYNQLSQYCQPMTGASYPQYSYQNPQYSNAQSASAYNPFSQYCQPYSQYTPTAQQCAQTPYDMIMQQIAITANYLNYVTEMLSQMTGKQSGGTCGTSNSRQSSSGCGCDDSSSASEPKALTMKNNQNLMITSGTCNYQGNDNGNIIIDPGNSPFASIKDGTGDDYVITQSCGTTVDAGEGNNVVNLQNSCHTVDATKGKNLIYVNSNYNTIKADADDIIALGDDVNPETIEIEGWEDPKVCLASDLTDADKAPFENALNRGIGEPNNDGDFSAGIRTAKDCLSCSGSDDKTTGSELTKDLPKVEDPANMEQIQAYILEATALVDSLKNEGKTEDAKTVLNEVLANLDEWKESTDAAYDTGLLIDQSITLFNQSLTECDSTSTAAAAAA